MLWFVIGDITVEPYLFYEVQRNTGSVDVYYVWLMFCSCLSLGPCTYVWLPACVSNEYFNSGSRGYAGMAGKRSCDPPILSDDVDFDEWDREIQIWQIATDVDKKKQGARIYLSLQGKARENCRNIDPSTLEGDGGVKVLIDKLKALYAKDAAQALFQTIEDFETYIRPENVNIKDFLNEWERRYDKCKAKKATWQDNVLAYKLLKAANLEQDKQVLIRATIKDLTVDEVKRQIRAVFDRTGSSASSNTGITDSNTFVKVEPTYYGDHLEQEEVYFSDGGSHFPRGRGRRGGRGFSNNRRGGSASRGSPSPSRGSSPFRGARSSSTPPLRNRNWDQDPPQQFTRRLNKPDRTGAPARCAICGSVMHFAKQCPHNVEQQIEQGEGAIPTLLTVQVMTSETEIENDLVIAQTSCDITNNENASYVPGFQNLPQYPLLQNNTEEEHEFVPSLFANNIHEKYKDCFTGEALHKAILDSGCRKTVCGRLWYGCFTDSLPSTLQQEIVKGNSSTCFKFGDGAVIPSMMNSIIPACINGMKINIQTEVIDSEIPLLLSKDAMKKANTILYFETDSVTMFGMNFPLDFTSSGHYMIHVHPSLPKSLYDNPVLMNLAELNKTEKLKVATKLHKQFGHADSSRLVELIKDAGTDDEDLTHCIESVEEKCSTCNSFKKPGLKPVVGFALSKEFNETVSMDLKDVAKHKIFHMIDTATRYSAGAIVDRKCKELIIEKFFMHWIALFGCPSKILSDNGGEFNNELMRELGEQLNIEVLSTAAESPWSNGITERHNALIGQMMIKVMDDQKCPADIALAWSLSAKYALKNVYGFSPNQLVFGHNPNLPSVIDNKLPALSGTTSSQLIAQHLNAMHASRKAFIECEASDKLRRALKSKTRPATSKYYHNGNKVLYKKEKDARWHGPGVVLGVDNKCVIIKHQGQIYRVAPCNLQLHVDDNTDVGPLPTQPPTETDFPVTQTERDDGTVVQEHIDDATEEHTSTIDGVNNTENPPSASASVIDNQPPEMLSNPTVENGEVPKKDSKIIYKLRGTEEVRNATVIGRGGTARGVNKYYFNVENEDRSLSGLDMEMVEGWKYADQILLLADHGSTDVLEAKMKELQNLHRHNVVTEVDDEGQFTIESRWVLTEKLKEGNKVTKARLVAKGFQEKENKDLRKDSPTILKVNLRLIACISSCYGWKVKALDIRSAFLQGETLDRDVYLRPPVEAGLHGKVWKLQKALYGLGDASRKWYLKVKNILLRLGVKMSIYDEALFYYHVNGVLSGLIGIHVDDFFHSG